MAIPKKAFRGVLNINDDDWERIEQYLLKNGEPVSDEDLFKIIITCKAETVNYEGSKIFFPDNKYELNDKIVILRRAGLVEFGRIVKIEPKHDFSLTMDSEGSHILPYCEIIHIEPLKGNWQSRAGYERLISASKEYLQEKLNVLTREELVGEFIDEERKEEIQTDIIKQLQEKGRIISDGKRWFLNSHLPKIMQNQIEAIFWRISEIIGSISTDYILGEILNIPPSSSEIELWRFAIECNLGEDRRFIRKDNGWTMAPPPRESVITVDDEAINAGLLKIGQGLRHMLAYYKVKDNIKFLTYGYYEISGTINEDYKTISGQDITAWYMENNLHGGDKVHVRWSSEREENFRIYTEIETKKPIPPKGSFESKRVYIRRLIYEFLTYKGEFCVLADIKNGIEASRKIIIEEVSLKTVLTNNSHLFEPLSPSGKLWGLRIWGVGDKCKYVNLNSLLLTIQEDDLVFKIIEESEEPISNKEIASYLAKLFCLPLDLIFGTSFLDTHDNRIMRLPDGRLTLKINFEYWKKRLDELDSYLAYHNRIEKKASELKSKAVVFKKESDELKNTIEKKAKALSIKKSELNRLLVAKSSLYYSLATQIIRYSILFMLLISAMMLYWQIKRSIYALTIITMVLGGLALLLLLIAIFVQKNAKTKTDILKTYLEKSNENINHISREMDKLQSEYSNKEQLIIRIEVETEELEKEILHENIEKIFLERKQLKEKIGIYD